MPPNNPSSLKIQQVNCFYNYTIGLDITEVDLLKTAVKLISSGVATSVFFSDMKIFYLDEKNKLQVDMLHPEGRQWDSSWSITFKEKAPKKSIKESIFCLDLSFHERQIETPNSQPHHLRASLPPIVLERNESLLPVYPWLKVYADGIMSISFQLDTQWEDLDEIDFINDLVNLYQRYFDRIWIQAEIQRIDGKHIPAEAFEMEMSIGGHRIFNDKADQIATEMRRKSEIALEKSLMQEGDFFDLGGQSWCLHQIAGSEEQDKWEATLDLCRSIYTNAIVSLIAVKTHKKHAYKATALLWQGRPSISLVRFSEQPEDKKELLDKFGKSISRIMMRSASVESPPPPPCDLRPIPDFCFHGNRSILLWTWLKAQHEPNNAWDDRNTRSRLLNNQARAEHFEYHNMRIAKACSTANSVSSDEDLIYAYATLTNAEAMVQQSSQVGEVVDALKYLIDATGTTNLITSAKENARWRLDERRFRQEKKRYNIDRWLTIMFGLVGAAGLGDLVFKPLLKYIYSDLPPSITGLAAFLLAVFFMIISTLPIWAFNHLWKK